MRKREDYLLNGAILAADRVTLTAINHIEGYTAKNPSFAVPALIVLEKALREAELEAERAQAAAEAARRRLILAQWAFHNGMLGAKAEVIVQFGAESEYVHAMGLKRKSERKRPTRRRSSPSV